VALVEVFTPKVSEVSEIVRELVSFREELTRLKEGVRESYHPSLPAPSIQTVSAQAGPAKAAPAIQAGPAQAAPAQADFRAGGSEAPLALTKPSMPSASSALTASAKRRAKKVAKALSEKSGPPPPSGSNPPQ